MQVKVKQYYLYTDYFPFNAQQNIYEYHYLGVQIIEDALYIWLYVTQYEPLLCVWGMTPCNIKMQS